MKKMYLLLGLMTAVAVPSVGSAALVLDVPPILAAGSSQETCTVNGDCSTGFCCNGRCYAAGSGACCNSGNIYCSGIATCTSCANPCDNSCNQPATGGLNDTGITFGANYSTGNNTTCTGETVSAQDCSIGRDATAGGFDFTTQGSCVKDGVTKLTWSPHQGGTTGIVWADIAGQIAAANTGSGLCGMTGWRAPTLKELLGIVSYHSASSAYDNAFLDTKTDKPYWSGSEANSNVGAVSFIRGETTILSKSTIPYYLRLVSGTVTTANLKDNADGTVTDSSTKLMWKKCLEGLSGDTCTGTASTFTWQGALQRPGTVNGAGFPVSPNYKDWRLPNIKELQSIVDTSKSNPAIDLTKFPNAAASQAWSSSPYVLVGTYSKSWAVDFGTTGAVFLPLSRANTLNVRLVRDMQ